MLDWTLDLFFRRGITLLSPRYTTRLREIHLEPGDMLYHSGEPAFSLYIVNSGAMELFDAKEIIETVTAGGYFGEQALLEDGIWHYNARAKEPSTLVSIPANIFHQIVSGSGTLGRFFQKSASKYESREVVEAITQKIPAPMRTKTAGALMQRQLWTLKPEMKVIEAVEVLKAHPHSSYPIIDGAGKVLGVLRREDFYELIRKPQSTRDTPLSSMPLDSLPLIREPTTVDEIVQRLIRNGADKALVVDDQGHVRGILTMMDLITAAGKAPPQ